MKKLVVLSLVALSFLGGYIASNHEKSVNANENKQGNVNRIENDMVTIELVEDEYGFQLYVDTKNNMVLRSEIEVNDKDNFNELFFVARNKDFKIK
jgi:hypothetical protein